MHRRVAAERRAGKLAAAVGDHLVHVHVELGATARHPDMQGKHVVMLAGENFVAGLNDQFVALVVEPLAVVIGDGGGFLQGRVGRDHLAGNQILSDAEMLERALGLRAPELVGGNFDDAEAVRLFPHLRHGYSPSSYDWALYRFSVTTLIASAVNASPPRHSLGDRLFTFLGTR